MHDLVFNTTELYLQNPISFYFLSTNAWSQCNLVKHFFSGTEMDEIKIEGTNRMNNGFPFLCSCCANALLLNCSKTVNSLNQLTSVPKFAHLNVVFPAAPGSQFLLIIFSRSKIRGRKITNKLNRQISFSFLNK